MNEMVSDANKTEKNLKERYHFLRESLPFVSWIKGMKYRTEMEKIKKQLEQMEASE